MSLRIVLISSALGAALSGSSPAEEPGGLREWASFRGADRSGVAQSGPLLKSWPEGGPPLVWEAKGAGRGYAGVAIADDRVFTMGDTVAGGEGDDEYLLCYSKNDGTLLWKFRLGPPWNKGMSDWQSSRSTPTIDGDRVYALLRHAAHADDLCQPGADLTEL